MRLENNSIVEQNGIGEQIYYGQTYSAALDYTSDVDIYTASLQAGNTYYFSIQSNIPDIYLDVEYDQQAVASLVTAGSGLYYFTAGLSGNYELHISSNSFVNKGSYTLITQPDITDPIVAGYSPADGTTAVDITSNIAVIFNEAIQKGTGTIAIHAGSAIGNIVESFDAATSNLLFITGNTLTINPLVDLANNTQYFVTFDSGSVKDLAGNNYAGTTTYDFTTVQIPASTSDTIAPIVSGFFPSDGQTAVAITSNIALTFSEAIQKGTGTVAIHAGSTDGAVVESFDAATSNLLSIIDNTLTINPVTDLANNTHYFVTFDAGSIKDLAGNNYAGTTTYDFTTVTSANKITDGNDALVGTNASDLINGGKGADSMKGGLGNDTYYVDNAGDTVIENKSAGTDTVYSSISFILGPNVENLTLTGKATINGTGNGLNNTLIGNSAANKLSGLAGNDIIFGGLGKDKLTGGLGKDTFDFNASLEIGKGASRDSITDFSHGQHDRIDLSGIDANSKKAGNQAFTYLDSKAFDGKAGEIHFIKGILSGDTNGDKVADFEMSITLVGGINLASQDFVL